MIPAKRYIGDAVYVEYHSPGIRLTTEDGIRVMNEIILEPEVLFELERFLAQLKEAVR
jgi:hypothetical protein